MPQPQPIVAGILVGGKSKRMGVDKAVLPWRGSTILETIVHTARQVADECVLLGKPATLPASLTEMRRLPDAPPGIGPLGGLAAMLRAFPQRWCLLLSCDIPSVTKAALAALIDHQSPDIQVVAHEIDGNIEPCCALYRADILPHVERAIAESRFALHELIDSLRHQRIVADNQTRRALRNVNDYEDYLRAQTDP